MTVSLTGLKPAEIPLMLEELGNLGTVQQHQESDSSLEVVLDTTVSEDDITAVLCFVLEPEQIHFTRPTAEVAPQVSLEEAALSSDAVTTETSVVEPAPVSAATEATVAPAGTTPAQAETTPAAATPAEAGAAPAAPAPHIPRHNPVRPKGQRAAPAFASPWRRSIS